MKKIIGYLVLSVIGIFVGILIIKVLIFSKKSISDVFNFSNDESLLILCGLMLLFSFCVFKKK